MRRIVVAMWLITSAISLFGNPGEHDLAFTTSVCGGNTRRAIPLTTSSKRPNSSALRSQLSNVFCYNEQQFD